ncbi:hypothetical protein BB559_000352 [Furculomyces boomerangus]|uniref:Protein kinase domain-containing protein n=2 Tax=Harpellales TaxID=61421 RepID=A0A2T9Z5G7_9FUNG|nr:hypothetical protein BB559_000352 [Furculomyces boomerangus]PWA01651.1 hypothetical protein BB558_002227 [Smittium angustum]
MSPSCTSSINTPNPNELSGFSKPFPFKNSQATYPNNQNEIKNSINTYSTVQNHSKNSSMYISDQKTLPTNPNEYLNSQYDIVKQKLGQGSSSSVALYQNILTKKLVVVKKIKNKSSITNIETKSYFSEVQVLSMTNHPNIIRMFDYARFLDISYVMVEYCKSDLLVLIQSGLNENEIGCYFQQLISGVNYLHKMGIAHRDLKLNNLCISNDGVLKIIDFGLALIEKKQDISDTDLDDYPVLSNIKHSELTKSKTEYNNSKDPKSFSLVDKRQTYTNQFLKRIKVKPSQLFSRTSNFLKGLKNNSAIKNISSGTEKIDVESQKENTDRSYQMAIIDDQELPQIEKNESRKDFTENNKEGLLKSCFVDDLNQVNVVFCGTKPYIAPEIYQQFYYDARKADVWAVGIILFSMLVKSYPWKQAKWDDKHYKKFLSNKKSFIKALLLSLKPRLQNISFFIDTTTKLLEPIPKKRPSTNDIIKDKMLGKFRECGKTELHKNHTLPFL